MEDRYIWEIVFDWSAVPEDAYPRKISALRGLERLRLNRNVTLLCGVRLSQEVTIKEI